MNHSIVRTYRDVSSLALTTVEIFCKISALNDLATSPLEETRLWAEKRLEGIKRIPPLIREIFRGSARNFATAKLPAKYFADARDSLRPREIYRDI